MSDKNREIRVTLRDEGLEGLLKLDDPFMVREMLINALDGSFARSESTRRLTQRQKNAIREAIGFRLSGESDDVDREALEGALENL